MNFVNIFTVIFLMIMLVTFADTESSAVGKGFYLPDKDIFSPLLGGNDIFKKIDGSCYKWKEQGITLKERSAYENTHTFYHKISSNSHLSVDLVGKYTMGATLNVKTQSISSGETNIKGESLNIGTYVNASYIDESCFKSSESQLTDDLISMFDSLPLTITNPWLLTSWQHYETFLKTFGSHFVTKSDLGIAVRQWTFAKSSKQYTFEQLNIRVCVDLAGPTNVGELNVTACSGITQAQVNSVANLETTNYLEIHGGSDTTRNRFITSRSSTDLEKLLNEGRLNPSPVNYEYTAIWDILMTKFFNDPTRFAKAMNLMHYYIGYKDFGCSYLSSSKKIKLRSFNYSPDSSRFVPIFHCILINKGCHSDDDCRVGGAGSVTYCYGNSCYEYKEPVFGSKAKSVVVRTSGSGSYKTGVNLSCYYSFFSASCHNNYFDPLVIWDGEEKARKALRLFATASSASQLFPFGSSYLFILSYFGIYFLTY